MSKNIKLTPVELKNQAAEMKDLAYSYKTIFDGVIGDVKNINDDWSENLSHNFTPKKSAAQNSFVGAFSALDFGATEASSIADDFEDVDKKLAEAVKKFLGSSSVNPEDLLANGETLDDKEKKLAYKAGSEIGKDILSAILNMGKFAKNVLKGDFVSASNDTWRFINNICDVAQDTASLFTIGIGKGISFVTGDDSYREVALEEAEEARSNDGLTDYMKSMGAPDWMIKTSETLDTASDVKGLYDSVTGFYSDATEAGKVLGSENLSFDTKVAYVKDVFLDELGISKTDYSNETFKGKLNNKVGFFNNIKNGYEWITKISEGETLDEILKGKLTLPSLESDARETSEEIVGLIYGDPTLAQNKDGEAQIIVDAMNYIDELKESFIPWLVR